MADEQGASSAMEVLVRDYQQTIEELSGGPTARTQALAKFREEYEKLYTALDRSHDSEKRLAKRIRDLNHEITGSSSSLQTAMKAAAEDQQQILTLRADIEANEKLVEEYKQKETTASDAIARLKGEIAVLVEKIDSSLEYSPEQQLLIDNLAAQKEQLEKDKDVLKQSTDMLADICAETADKVQRAEGLKGDAEERIIDMKQRVADKKTEVEQEKRRKEELEQKMKDLRVENELKQEDVLNIQREVKKEEDELRKTQQDLADIRKEEDRLVRRVKQREEEKRKLEEKLEHELATNQKYVQENQQRELQFRKRRDEIQQHATEREKVMKLHDALKKKDKALEEERKSSEIQRTKLKDDIKTAQDEHETVKRDGDADRKKIEDLLRERDILNKNVIKADERTKKQIDLVKRQETQAMNMQKDIQRWKLDAAEFRKRILELEKQRENYGLELSQANAKYYAAQEELRTRAGTLVELKKQIANVQAKRNQQKNLYDAVVMDRNLRSKDLVESTNQINEMRRRFRIMFLQTNALKEEIREKDNRLVRGIFRQKNVCQSNKRLKENIEKGKAKMQSIMKIMDNQRKEIKKQEGDIHLAEQQKQAQDKELKGVIIERNILGEQLIRRNEELALLYEKIKIQQSTLKKGEAQFDLRLKEIRGLREKIRTAKANVTNAKSQVTNVDALKKEIHHLHNTLLREEAKAKALQEELDNPMNVHRWRALEGSDPATFEMITKVKTLQKKLIAKTEEVVHKDALIQENEKLYVQLRKIIAKQPGPEVAQQLSWYSQHLKDKTQHMKQMAQELEAYHTQVHDVRNEIAMHQKDFSATKQTYFQQLRQQRSRNAANTVAAAN
jgi:chromosome segregation ATPase